MHDTTTLVFDECISDSELASETKAIGQIKSVPNPPIDGAHVILCGIPAVVPALKALHLKKFASTIERIRKEGETMPQAELMDITIPVIHAAMSRNYPSLTVGDVLHLVDIGVFNDVILGILGRSGYRTAKPGE
jgi:hypothetical protein